jgi:hypothetical protein
MAVCVAGMVFNLALVPTVASYPWANVSAWPVVRACASLGPRRTALVAAAT